MPTEVFHSLIAAGAISALVAPVVATYFCENHKKGCPHNPYNKGRIYKLGTATMTFSHSILIAEITSISDRLTR